MAMQTFTPIQYLKIDVAGSFGHDKLSWDDRIAWFDQNEADVLELAELTDQAKIKKHPLIQKADSPALLYAGAKAYAQASRGEAISYPVSLDATASGAQILAVLIGCDKSARLCNVIDTGNREDLYTNVYNLMLGRLGTNSNISRADSKQAVMTSLYGSKREPEKVFGEGEQLMAFYQTMEEDASGIWELNKALLNQWQPENLSHDWVLPDNFHVHVKVEAEREEWIQWMNAPVKVTTKVNAPTEEGRSIGANVVHSLDGMVVREVVRRCNYDVDQLLALMELLTTEIAYRPFTTRPQDLLVQTLWDRYLESGFLSARILELLDADNLLRVDREVIRQMIATLPDHPFPVLSVHDCFRVHPNYANDLRRTYNQILHEIAKSKVLGSIVGQITNEPTYVHKYQDLSAQVLDANYALS
jgi:hypothetical protein